MPFLIALLAAAFLCFNLGAQALPTAVRSVMTDRNVRLNGSFTNIFASNTVDLARVVTLKVDTVAQLRALTNLPVGTMVDVAGYYAAGDGGGGAYNLVASTSGTNAHGGRILAAGGSSIWSLKAEDGKVHPRQFGARGDAVNDDEPSLRACSDYVSAGYASIMVLSKGEYLVARSWRIGDNFQLEATPDHWVVRGFTNLYQPFATVRNINFYFNTTNPVWSIPANNTNIVLNGLRIRPKDLNMKGQGLALYGVHNLTVKGLTIQRTIGDWGTAFMGKKIRISDVNVMSNAFLYEDGIHISGGEDVVVENCNITSGDDITAVGEDGADVYCQDVTFNNITGHSEKGYMIKIFAPPVQTAGSTLIQRISYNNMVGSGGATRNGGFYIGEFGTPRGAITNVSISQVRMVVNTGGASHDGVQAFGAAIIGCADLNFRDVKILGARQYPLYISTPKGRMFFDNCEFGAANPGLDDSVQLLNFAGNDAIFRDCTFVGGATNAIFNQEGNLYLLGGTINYTNQAIAFSQATQSTRNLVVSGVEFRGSGLTPVRSVGANGFLKRFEFSRNITPSGSAFVGSPEFGPGVFIFGNTGLGEQNRITSGVGGNNTYIFTDGGTGKSTLTLTAGNSTDRRLDLQDANLSAFQASTGYPTNLVLNGGGGFIQLGGSGAALNGVTVGAGTPLPSAALSVHSTTQGFVVVPITKSQRNAISSPVNGLMIYQFDSGNYGPRWYSTTLGGWMKADGTADP